MLKFPPTWVVRNLRNCASQTSGSGLFLQTFLREFWWNWEECSLRNWKRLLGITQFSLYMPFTDWFGWPTLFPVPRFSPPPPAFSFSCLVTDLTHRTLFVSVWRMPNRKTSGLLLRPWVGPQRQLCVKLGARKGGPR